jgi:hypothetical protein
MSKPTQKAKVFAAPKAQKAPVAVVAAAPKPLTP